jgi:hypothetical protein
MATRRPGARVEPKRDVHVVPHYNGWATKREGGVRVGRLAETQAEAIEIGKRMAKRDKVQLVVHGRDSKIQDRYSYGKDPLPEDV